MEVELEETSIQVYDMVSKNTLEITNNTFKIAPGSSVVLVHIPKDGAKEIKDGKLLIDDVIVDYNYAIK